MEQEEEDGHTVESASGISGEENGPVLVVPEEELEILENEMIKKAVDQLHSRLDARIKEELQLAGLVRSAEDEEAHQRELEEAFALAARIPDPDVSILEQMSSDGKGLASSSEDGDPSRRLSVGSSHNRGSSVDSDDRSDGSRGEQPKVSRRKRAPLGPSVGAAAVTGIVGSVLTGVVGGITIALLSGAAATTATAAAHAGVEKYKGMEADRRERAECATVSTTGDSDDEDEDDEKRMDVVGLSEKEKREREKDARKLEKKRLKSERRFWINQRAEVDARGRVLRWVSEPLAEVLHDASDVGVVVQLSNFTSFSLSDPSVIVNDGIVCESFSVPPFSRSAFSIGRRGSSSFLEGCVHFVPQQHSPTLREAYCSLLATHARIVRQDLVDGEVDESEITRNLDFGLLCFYGAVGRSVLCGVSSVATADLSLQGEHFPILEECKQHCVGQHSHCGNVFENRFFVSCFVDQGGSLPVVKVDVEEVGLEIIPTAADIVRTMSTEMASDVDEDVEADEIDSFPNDAPVVADERELQRIFHSEFT